MDVTSYLLGKKSGGGTPINNQNKNVTITENGTTTVSADAGYTGLGTVGITANVQPNLESKSVTITENTTTTITPTSGKDGLSSVSVTTNVPGAVTPTKGFVINNWDANGYPTEITTYGFQTITNSYFAITNISAFYYLENVNFNSGITELGSSVFSACQHLSLTSLPETLTTIGYRCFNNCNLLAITTIPDSVTTFGDGVFGNCVSLKKISMKNVTILPGNARSNGAFNGCSNLKKAWIGSGVTDILQHTFTNCGYLDAIYIDKPRATVETFSGYSYAFMNDATKTGIIICNDDADFIDKATFDAMVVS